MVLPVDKIPPQSIEAEQSVLGSMIIEKKQFLPPWSCSGKDFYGPLTGRSLRRSWLCQKREPVDLVTLADELQRRHALEEAGEQLI